jgi:hypothetical protein
MWLPGCASAPVEFDPTETPFEGEWNALWSYGGKNFISTYTFSGNRWELKNNYNDGYQSGFFNYTEKIMYTFESIVRTQGKIQFSNEKGKGKQTQNYEFKGSYRFLLSQYGYFTKQPYGDLVISYVTKEKSFSYIVTNENELARIQGTWRHYNKLATYIFSGNKFTVNAQGRKPISGTVKIADNILYLIVSDEPFGLYYIEFLPNNKIYLNELWGHPSSWLGRFIKQ